MKSLLESFGIALCGLTTTILVALADVAIARMTGIDIYTFSIWVVVPAGAAFTGAAAACGYYFGSLYFHKRAAAPLLVQMVVIAGAAQLLIYWMGYTTMVLEDGRKVADLICRAIHGRDTHHGSLPHWSGPNRHGRSRKHGLLDRWLTVCWLPARGRVDLHLLEG